MWSPTGGRTTIMSVSIATRHRHRDPLEMEMPGTFFKGRAFMD
ncbi:hypothetical protein ATCC53582_00816 [Novacetimonas hansenii]|nr:hypothetical protein ATCC53582_00816 [Novacetimonas hansenii]